MARLDVIQFPCLDDNYGFLVRDPETGACATIDTPDASAIQAAAAQAGWKITEIWNTHWHPDHAGGNGAIKAETGAIVTAPSGENGKIAIMDKAVSGGDRIQLGSVEAHVIDVGGHTLGHIAYYFPEAKIAFVGDALFALGCGRMFEGTAPQFWASLSRLAELPDDTVVYCAHEYTASNAKFAATIETDNQNLTARIAEIIALRADGKPTVPTSIGLEKQTNPFLRADLPSVRVAVAMTDAPAHEVFAEVRRRKDVFR
jgi:hydroxyacylglutathione hydrolase